TSSTIAAGEYRRERNGVGSASAAPRRPAPAVGNAGAALAFSSAGRAPILGAMRQALSLLLCAALALPSPWLAADPINLPDLGDDSSAIISPAQERKLGEDFMRRARGTLAIADDPEVTAYLQTLGQRLVAR